MENKLNRILRLLSELSLAAITGTIILGATTVLIFVLLNFREDPEIAGAGTAIGTIILAISTMVLALISLKSIRQTRDDNKKREEREHWKRRLDEVQAWVNEVLRLKADCANRSNTTDMWRGISSKANNIIANSTYVKLEASKIDSEFQTKTSLVNSIEMLSGILNVRVISTLSGDAPQKDIEELSEKSLTKISEMREKLLL